MAARHLVALLAHLRDDLRAQVRGTWRRGLDGVRRAWAARPPQPRLAAQGLVVGLVLLGLASLDARGRLADRLPAPRDWRALGALLDRDARPGDLVAILPPWLERARQVAPAALPVLATSALDTEWLPGIRRVWLVAAEGVATLGPSLPLSGRAGASVTQQVGRLQVTRLDLARPVIPGASLAEWTGADTRWREVGGVARRCMELAPDAGPPLGPEPPPLLLGSALGGHVALLPASAAGPARLLVRIDGAPPVPVLVTAADEWQPFRVDTLRFAETSRSVTLEAEAPPGALLCVEALVLP
jgi:hypothetical protein